MWVWRHSLTSWTRQSRGECDFTFRMMRRRGTKLQLSASNTIATNQWRSLPCSYTYCCPSLRNLAGASKMQKYILIRLKDTGIAKMNNNKFPIRTFLSFLLWRHLSFTSFVWEYCLPSPRQEICTAGVTSTETQSLYSCGLSLWLLLTWS